MTSRPDDLIKDPLFQLNAILWLAQPMPQAGEIRPLLRDRGFTVHSIGAQLPLPPDLNLKAREAGIALQAAVRPDVVLERASDRSFALIECKGASFGTASSTSEQARTLLLAAGPRACEFLGLAPAQVSRALACFALPEDDRVPLDATLASLCNEIEEAGMLAGPHSVLGFLVAESDIALVIGPDGSGFFSLPAGPHAFLKREADTDPRPLYFIPYDPDLFPSAEEQEVCKRFLFERIHATVIAVLGHAIPPGVVAVKSHDVLNDAMFGIYGLWDNPASKRHMRDLCKHLMTELMKAIESMTPNTVVFQPQVGWRFDFQDEAHHERVMEAVLQFSCEKLSTGQPSTPELFDSFDDEGSPQR